MLDITFEAISRKKRDIQKRIDVLKDERKIEKYKSRWKETDFQKRAVVIGAEDGSINHKKYKSIILYAVNASALVLDKKIREAKFADVDILYPYRDVNDRLDAYRTIFELKAGLEVMDEVNLFLVDGSIYSDLISPRNPARNLALGEREEVEGFLPKIEEDETVKIVSKTLADRIKGKNRFKKILYLEYLEYLTTIKRFIEKGRGKIVGVSKTSTRSSFQEGMPDIAVFDEVSQMPGYGFADEKVKVLQKKFPVYGEFFNSFVPFFTYFYARLEKNKGVLMMDVPGDIKEDGIKSLLNKISSISIDGYPYLLRKAHKNVVIKNRDIDRFAASLGIKERTGRGALAW